MTLFLYGSVGALTGKLVEFAAFIAYPAFITTTLGLTVLAVNSVKHYLSEPLRPIPASTSPEPEPKSPSADSAISNPTDDELLTIPQKVSLDTPFNHNDLDLDDVLVGLLKEARAIDLAEQDI
jgi:hypothetical protein